MFRLDQVTTNGFTCMSPGPMLKAKQQIMNHAERELWTSQNGGSLKNGLSERLSFYRGKLDILGKF